MYKRGEIWLANLNPSKGTEPGKIRPVLIVQCQDLLDVSHPSTLIIPLTTKLVDNAVPLRFRIPTEGQLKIDSDLLVDQIRAIDNKRLIDGPLLQCSNSMMSEIDQCISEVFGL
jgi:mRNA interferase MazF